MCVDFALASYTDEDIDYKAVIERVQKLNEYDRSLYGAYFTVLLAWPTDTLTPGHTSVGMSTTTAVKNLKKKWRASIHKTAAAEWKVSIRKTAAAESAESQSVYDRSLPHHQISVRKPNTHHLLAKGKGKDLQSFVHIGMFHATQSTLEEERHKFWTRTEVTEKLVTLEGKLQDDREMLVYTTKEKEVVYIIMSRRWPCQPSRGLNVSFFLGFTFAGPVAYNVKEKDRKTVPICVKDNSGPYPGYLINNLPNLQKREEEITAKLDQIAYLLKKRRYRQQLTPEDVSLYYSKFQTCINNLHQYLKMAFNRTLIHV